MPGEQQLTSVGDNSPEILTEGRRRVCIRSVSDHPDLEKRHAAEPGGPCSAASFPGYAQAAGGGPYLYCADLIDNVLVPAGRRTEVHSEGERTGRRDMRERAQYRRVSLMPRKWLLTEPFMENRVPP